MTLARRPPSAEWDGDVSRKRSDAAAPWEGKGAADISEVPAAGCSGADTGDGEEMGGKVDPHRCWARAVRRRGNYRWMSLLSLVFEGRMHHEKKETGEKVERGLCLNAKAGKRE